MHCDCHLGHSYLQRRSLRWCRNYNVSFFLQITATRIRDHEFNNPTVLNDGDNFSAEALGGLHQYYRRLLVTRSTVYQGDTDYETVHNFRDTLGGPCCSIITGVH